MYARSLAGVRTYIHSQCTNTFSFCSGNAIFGDPVRRAGIQPHVKKWRVRLDVASPQLASAPPPLHIIRSHTSAISALFISGDNERIYSGNISGLAVITSTRSCRPLGLEGGEKQVITSVCGFIITSSVLALSYISLSAEKPRP